MNSQNNQKNNKRVRVAQYKQARHFFSSLKIVAFVLFTVGICLITLFALLNVGPVTEFIALTLFGLSSLGFIVARGRSILLIYEKKIENKSRNEKS